MIGSSSGAAVVPGLVAARREQACDRLAHALGAARDEGTLAGEAKESTTQVRRLLGEIQRGTSAAVMAKDLLFDGRLPEARNLFFHGLMAVTAVLAIASRRDWLLVPAATAVALAGAHLVQVATVWPALIAAPSLTMIIVPYGSL